MVSSRHGGISNINHRRNKYGCLAWHGENIKYQISKYQHQQRDVCRRMARSRSINSEKYQRMQRVSINSENGIISVIAAAAALSNMLAA